ncbi:MAG: sulfotransferase domain-containing protein [Candidatus Omnitrophica bacterium]|nr:sulfotransferase domain-containing protein [Candidatus Omnitrophota bacterium]
MLPNLIIIGAAKCGTTSLHYYLNLHPDIVMSDVKELNFFTEEFNWSKGLDWYQNHFKGEAKIFGESSPHYTNFPFYKGVPKRMHEVIPGAKLIFMVRDPFERMTSHYLDTVKGYLETRPFEEAMRDVNGSEYVPRSKYFYQLQQFLEYYPKERIFVLEAEELKNNRMEILQGIYQFLGVDDTFISEEVLIEKNVNADKLKAKKARRWVRDLIKLESNPDSWFMHIPAKMRENIKRTLLPKGEAVEKPEFSKELKEMLTDELKEDVKQLRQVMGLKLEHWPL